MARVCIKVVDAHVSNVSKVADKFGLTNSRARSKVPIISPQANFSARAKENNDLRSCDIQFFHSKNVFKI